MTPAANLFDAMGPSGVKHTVRFIRMNLLELLKTSRFHFLSQSPHDWCRHFQINLINVTPGPRRHLLVEKRELHRVPVLWFAAWRSTEC